MAEYNIYGDAGKSSDNNGLFNIVVQSEHEHDACEAFACVCCIYLH
jgi:hypothetical protein